MKKGEWTPDLVARFSGAYSAAEAIRLVGGLLVRAGAITPAHIEAAVARESDYPTALPAEIPFALVHTDGPGALEPGAALGIFREPVPFHRMDQPEEILMVQLVAMLSVPDRSAQAEVVKGIVDALADGKTARALLDADSLVGPVASKAG